MQSSQSTTRQKTITEICKEANTALASAIYINEKLESLNDESSNSGFTSLNITKDPSNHTNPPDQNNLFLPPIIKTRGWLNKDSKKIHSSYPELSMESFVDQTSEVARNIVRFGEDSETITSDNLSKQVTHSTKNNNEHVINSTYTTELDDKSSFILNNQSDPVSHIIKTTKNEIHTNHIYNTELEKHDLYTKDGVSFDDISLKTNTISNAYDYIAPVLNSTIDNKSQRVYKYNVSYIFSQKHELDLAVIKNTLLSLKQEIIGALNSSPSLSTPLSLGLYYYTLLRGYNYIIAYLPEYDPQGDNNNLSNLVYGPIDIPINLDKIVASNWLIKNPNKIIRLGFWYIIADNKLSIPINSPASLEEISKEVKDTLLTNLKNLPIVDLSSLTA
jgi:hypothetical protein